MKAVKIVYGLYVLSYFIGITAFIGVVYAYSQRGRDPMADSHLTYQIKTFWISLGVFALGVIFSFMALGVLILILLFLWTMFRLASGVFRALEGRPINEVRYFNAWAV